MPANDLKYSELIETRYVLTDLIADTKHAAIDELIDLLQAHDGVSDIDAVRAAVHDRETLMSTGVGLGLGLPHAKSAGVTRTAVAVGISRNGIEFESVDGIPVKIVFVLVGPDTERSEHIRILSWISRLMNSEEFRSKIVGSSSSEEVVEMFSTADKKLYA